MKSSLPEIVDITNDAQAGVLYILRNLYRRILLTDLDYALDKKVEQDLWNICFKIPISGLQPIKGKKTSNPLLNWFLEGASGFYLVLLQEVCAQCDFDSTLCKRNVQLGIFCGPCYSVKPKKESFLYICQHCLIHLGDIARYRNLVGEAESYYKQAVCIEPSSGHPYNQLALLESVRGDGLSTLYYYVRSLSLKHPFPPAKTNLLKVLKKQLVHVGVQPKSRGSRFSAEEFTISFLKLQGQIGLGCELDQAEQTVQLLWLTLPSLIATEAINSTQLIKALAITLYFVEECSSALATDAQKRSLQLATTLSGALLNACLTACCSLPVEHLIQSKYLAVIKLMLDWFYAHPEHLGKMKKGQIWSSVAKLLNQLQLCLTLMNDSEDKEDDGKPLPEDLELIGFKPLRPAYKWTSLKVETNETLTRATRIINRGKWIAERESPFLTIQQRDEEPKMLFSSLRPESPVEKQTEVLSKVSIKEEPVKEIKILARPPQRNVALAAILKQKTDEQPSVVAPVASEPVEPSKQVTFQPVKQPLINFPRPALPPRLERTKVEPNDQKNAANVGWYSSFGAASTLPDLSIPPPPVPPPGLGFPPPPAAWSAMLPPPPAPPYSLFSSNASWLPGPLPNFPPNSLPSEQAQRPVHLGPASLWSGPGPSPLERLLEQQKAMRGSGSSPAKK